MSNYLFKVHPCDPQNMLLSSRVPFFITLSPHAEILHNWIFVLFEVTGTLGTGTALFLALVRKIKMFRRGAGQGIWVRTGESNAFLS